MEKIYGSVNFVRKLWRKSFIVQAPKEKGESNYLSFIFTTLKQSDVPFG